MADDISKAAVAILLILTIVVSVVGTLAVLSSVGETGDVQHNQRIGITESSASGTAKLAVQQPTKSSGEVTLRIANGGGQ